LRALTVELTYFLGSFSRREDVVASVPWKEAPYRQAAACAAAHFRDNAHAVSACMAVPLS
jgi:hypothetical protein